jgi:Flp pilus assembly protein TadD
MTICGGDVVLKGEVAMPLVAEKVTGSTAMMKEFELKELFARGVAAVDNGDTVNGLLFLEKTGEVFSENPVYCSYLAVCIARERQDFDSAVRLCMDSIEVEPRKPLHYLNLGRIYLAAGDRKEAIRAFRNGLMYGNNDLIQSELNQLGWRKPPVIPALDRKHPLNVFLGKLGARLHLR